MNSNPFAKIESSFLIVFMISFRDVYILFTGIDLPFPFPFTHPYISVPGFITRYYTRSRTLKKQLQIVALQA